REPPDSGSLIRSWIEDPAYWDQRFSGLLDAFSRKRAVSVGGVSGTAAAFACAALSRLSGSVLVVTPGQSSAESLRDDLASIAGQAFLLPSYESLPWEGEPAHPAVIADRVECLASLRGGRGRSIVVCPAQSLAKLLPPPESFSTLALGLGDMLSMESVEDWLIATGYSRESCVYEQGRWSRRGGILDIGSFGHDNPVRIEFYGDEIESIRGFDLRSQRSMTEMRSVVLLPAREVVLPPDRWNSALDRVGEDNPLAELLWSATGFPGIEHYLPLFFDELVPVWEYFDAASTPIVVCEPEAVLEALRNHLEAVTDSLPGELPFGCRELFLDSERFAGALGSWKGGRAELMLIPRSDVDLYFHTLPQESYVGYPEEMARQFREWDREGYSIGVACDTEAELARFLELLPPGSPVQAAVMPLAEGFRMPEERLALLVERRLLSGRPRPERPRRFRGGETLASYEDLQPDDYVVHREFGIGRFVGLERVSTQEQSLDCLAIVYADDDRLLIPVDEIEQVQKYLAPTGVIPELDRLGSPAWKKRVARARERAREIAGRLAVIYAERRTSSREAFASERHLLDELEQSFPYEETPDQDRAIEEVKSDLSGGRPMDRLVCGDVGYGKTEVAVRAAFAVATAGYQVAVLVPTTVLAEQHYRTFRDRLAEFPVRVEQLSRFRSRREQREVLRSLAEGTTDIVVGTHRLLQRDVRFHRLGLLVVDEEHRFGVAQKEYLSEIRAGLDTLSMTATPIPRTLHMSLSGFRDISVITTPPRDRYPIQTEISAFSSGLITRAIGRELEREGQVFFVHNRIETIDRALEKLSELMPRLRIAVAHGQMKSSVLEGIMRAFVEGHFDLLLSTAIIESGLDLPRVNTIFVDNAHTFGLAELYQLRGRVGRSHHKAYAYLLIPCPLGKLAPDAAERLETIRRYTELGSGWHIAMRDLEIRGAGELLGMSQHGHMTSIGYSLFEDLIREEVRALQGVPEQQRRTVRVEVVGDSFIPESFMPDVLERVRAYRQVWRACSEEEIDDWMDFVRDRFGEPPVPVVNCRERARIRLLALQAGAEEVVASSLRGRVVLSPGASPEDADVRLARDC
ncbi:transcription-repair coupling factor, partial [Candidatus Fermentibacterales bacterium]|nr:transcription-repair coupling factor [Candidatus Fermentibacterales bacterium]